MARKTKKFKQARSKSIQHDREASSEALMSVSSPTTPSKRTSLYVMSDLDTSNRVTTQRDTIKSLMLLGLLLVGQYLVYVRIDDLKRFFL